MKRSTHKNVMYMTGKCLALPLSLMLRLQKPLISWLVSKGLSPSLIKRAFIYIDLALFASLFLLILPNWVVLIIGFALFIIYFGADIDFEITPPKEPELKNGWDGFGYYNQNDFRLDGSAEDED